MHFSVIWVMLLPIQCLSLHKILTTIATKINNTYTFLNF
nr:MAG TPA: hypothetical protein [Caudoviricetes sp.]